MNNQIREIIKQYTRSEMLKTRSQLKITQVEMASRLNISSREYTNIESGKVCCSTITMLVYLNEICSDSEKFLDGLKAALDAGGPDAA